jgi:ABC-type transporter Mla subunit MlaD
MVKIKVVIILCFICLIIGACGTGFAIYKLTYVNAHKLETANADIARLNKQIKDTQQQTDNTIAGLNKQLDSFDKYIGELKTIISRFQTISNDLGNTNGEIEKLLQRLADLNKNITDGIDKYINRK